MFDVRPEGLRDFSPLPLTGETRAQQANRIYIPAGDLDGLLSSLADRWALSISPAMSALGEMQQGSLQ